MYRYTTQEVKQLAKNLQPKWWFSAPELERDTCIMTPVVRCLDGRQLHNEDGTVLAGYIRVSTERQRSKRYGLEDGYSITDQIERICGYAYQQRQAFVIYSDAGISGKVPINDNALIREVRQKEAGKFVEMFNSLFLSPYVTRRYDETQRASIVRYRDRREQEILNTVERDEYAMDEQPSFRPALDHLIKNAHRYHTLALIDSSRLCRSILLTEKLVEALYSAGVRFKGLIEDLSYWNERTLGAGIIRSTMAQIAEHHLTETLSGNLRGSLQMLESGRPPMKVGGWLSMDETTGLPYLNDKSPGYRRMVELYLADEDASANKVAERLYAEAQALDVDAPKKNPYLDRNGKAYLPVSIYAALQNDNMIGIVEEFGLRFDILPHLIDRESWDRLQSKIERRRPKMEGKPQTFKYLASGLFHCTCGARLIWRPNGRTEGAYACNKVYNADPSREKYPHTFLPASTIHQFLNDLMAHHGSRVLEITGAGSRMHALDGAPEAQNLAAAEPYCKVPEAEPALAALNNAGKRTLEEQVVEWHALSEQQRNRLLRRIFASFRVEGEKPEQVIRVRSHSTRRSELPPITIRYRPHGKRWFASLPTAQEWITLA